jgi:hypothetical protein
MNQRLGGELVGIERYEKVSASRLRGWQACFRIRREESRGEYCALAGPNVGVDLLRCWQSLPFEGPGFFVTAGLMMSGILLIRSFDLLVWHTQWDRKASSVKNINYLRRKIGRLRVDELDIIRFLSGFSGRKRSGYVGSKASSRVLAERTRSMRRPRSAGVYTQPIVIFYT